ncbi:J domain-containing protein [Chloropicon primus]|nr:J domain-containing protein [Chloropicon primus]
MGKGGARRSRDDVKALLVCIGLTNPEDLSGCSTVQEEFAYVKKCFRRKCLETHPDKGGDAADFRDVQSAFETLRSMFERGSIPTFQGSAGTSTKKEYEAAYENMGKYSQPSYEFYEFAEDISVPQYRVELAKSGRSACSKPGTRSKNYQDKKCPIIPGETQYKFKTVARKLKSGTEYDEVAYTLISKGMIRIGVVDEQTGGYGRWCHLECWRVPKRIWLAMPSEGHPDEYKAEVYEMRLIALNEVLFEGMQELSAEHRAKLVRHVMDRGNWAQYKKPAFLKQRSPSKAPAGESASPKKMEAPKAEPSTPRAEDKVKSEVKAEPPASAPQAFMVPSSKAPSSSLVPKEKFVLPKPGVGNAKPGCLGGKTCVLTGVFPEVGGGSGLSLGKDRVKGMIMSFGGRVTSAISGKTDILVVGKDPGMSKVSKGRNQNRCTLLSLKDFCEGINNGTVSQTIEQAKPMVIETFSMGYKARGGFNSLMYRSSKEEIEYAQGKSPQKRLQGPTTENEGEKPAKKAKKSKRKLDLDEEAEEKEEAKEKEPLDKAIQAKLDRNKKQGHVPWHTTLLARELKALCKHHDVDDKGTKPVLIKRLNVFFEAGGGGGGGGKGKGKGKAEDKKEAGGGRGGKGKGKAKAKGRGKRKSV